MKPCPCCGSTAREEWSGEMCPACLLERGLLGFGEPNEEGATAAAAAAGTPVIGELFGDYELLAEVAAGGMGIVYRARQRSLNRIVAVKMIRSGHLARVADIRRFRTEAEAAAKLQHPGIVAIHEVGEIDGQHFFSMEYIDGHSLAEAVRDHPLPPRDAAHCVQRVAAAIQFAHDRGVLHRDLKPSNVMLGADGAPRVTDFGLAKVAGDVELTQTGVVLGSPGYMPPEQAQGRGSDIDARSDVYSMGGILYELLTGCPPFRAATPLETLKLVIEQEPVPPRILNPRLPGDLETICLKCLEKSPDRRYATAHELGDELGRWLRGEPIHARATGPFGKAWRWCRRRPALAASLALSFSLLAALIVVLGATAARLQREGIQTRAAKQEAEEKLWSAYLAQARAERLSGVAGRRTQSLRAVTSAARMKPSLDLRNEAIACLALSDLGETRTWRRVQDSPRHSMIAWDPRFERCAMQQRAGKIVIARAADYAVLAELEVPKVSVRYAEFSPDGRYLAMQAADGSARVWSVSVTNPPALVENLGLPVMPNHPSLLAFHPESRWAGFVGKDQVIHFRDISIGRPGRSLRLGLTPGYFTFAPTGLQIAIATGHEIQRWSWPALEPLRSFKHGAPVTCLAWHPDGRRLAAGDASGGLIGWDTEAGTYLTLPAHGQYVSHVAFHPHGEIAVSHGWDGLSRFWDTASARQLFSTITGLATKFSQDGRQLAFHREGVDFGTWEFVRSDVFNVVCPPLALTGADVSPDGRWLAYADPVGCHVWDLDAGRVAASAPLLQARSPWFHPRGDAIFLATPDRVMRWPIRVSTLTNTHPRLADDPDRPRATAAEPAAFTFGEPATLHTSPGSDFQRLSISPGADRVAAVGRRGNVVLDVKSPETPPRTIARGTSQSHVTLGPDPRWAVTATHNGMGMALWNTEGRLERLLLTNENSTAAFSNDGRTLVTTSSRDYCLWDTATWTVRRRIPLDLGSAMAGPIAFSPNGRLLAVAANRRDIKLLHPQTGDELATLTAPDSQNLSRLAFDATGSRLIATATARSVQVWDLRTLRSHLAKLGLDWEE